MVLIIIVFLVPFRCSSSWNLQSGWEKHGSHGSTGVWSWADCTDNNYFIFKDSCNTLNLLATLWIFYKSAVHKRKQSAVKLSRNGFSSWWIGITREMHGMWTANEVLSIWKMLSSRVQKWHPTALYLMCLCHRQGVIH